MTAVRHSYPNGGSFIRKDSVKATSTTETPLREHNGPEKPGRWHAPKEPRCLCSLASQAGHLAFAHSASAACAPADVFGRRFDTTSTNQMHAHDTTAARTEPPANRSYTPYTSGGKPEVYAETARRRGDISARTLRTLRSQTRVYYTHGESLCGHILSSWVEVYEVYKPALSDLPPRRPRKISYTSKMSAKCTYTSAAGGVVNA